MQVLLTLITVLYVAPMLICLGNSFVIKKTVRQKTKVWISAFVPVLNLLMAIVILAMHLLFNAFEKDR